MKKIHLIFAIVSLILAGSTHAQWKTETYNLVTGWNSIYLHGDATHVTPDLLFAANPQVTQVWRWNPNENQVQFTTTPLIPAPGQEEWTVWNGGAAPAAIMIGQAAYLVKCSAPATLVIPQRILPPDSTWVRNGANLLGFPTLKNGGLYPTFASYFATFPAAIAANAKIFKYVGGEIGPNNPMQVFSPLSERVDRNAAYWFSAEVVGNFYAPMELSLSEAAGLAFGRTGSEITVRIRNRTSGVVTVTLTPQASDNAPGGVSVPQVPLTRYSFNETTLLPEWHAISAVNGNNLVQIAGQTTVEVKIGINRLAMTGGTGELHASFLRLTDSGNLMDIYLPATAQKSSLAGLWVGDIELTGVVSAVSNSAQAAATVTNGVITAIGIVGKGGFGYTTAPAVTIAAPAGGGSQATATAIVENGSVKQITINSGGSGYAITSPRITIDPPPPLPGTSTPRSFPLRTLLHVPDSGPARLLSQVFIGPLAAVPEDMGLCAFESLLAPGAKATAQRLVAAHMPLDQIVGGADTVAIPGTLVRTITVPYNDPTNPFVHQYHPDHDNRTARFASIQLPVYARATATAVRTGHQITSVTITNAGSGYKTTPAVTIDPPPSGTTAVLEATLIGGKVTGITVVSPGSGYESEPAVTIADSPSPTVTTVKISDGVEAPGITRTCSFTFTAAPPPGSSASPAAWGSSVIGGTYSEVITGIHKNPIQMGGTFELRCASEDGVLVTQ